MPYITDEAKYEAFDGGLPNAGVLTFKIQELLQHFLEEHGLRYQQIAEILGSLEGAKLDFIERVVKPYEAKKRSENGDVWPLTLTGLMGDDDASRMHCKMLQFHYDQY
jgi:hypothetical protein